MRFADVVVTANDAALENREVTFNGVAASIAANVLANAVVNHCVAAKLLPTPM